MIYGMQSKYLYKNASHEIKNLVKIVKSRKEKIKLRKDVFYFLFDCVKQMELYSISRSDAVIFLREIIQIDIDFNMAEIIDSLSYKDMINRDVLFTWLMHYIVLENIKPELSLFKRIVNVINKKEYPPTYVSSYLAVKATRYDRILNSYKYNTNNPPHYQCYICKSNYKYPMILAKHIVKCKNSRL